MMAHFDYAAVKADNTVSQLFSEHDGDAAHLTALLNSGETLVAVSNLPDSGPYIYDPTTGTVSQDATAAATQAATARIEALIPLYERQTALQAMSTAGEDVAAALADVAAEIAAL